jgi:chromosome transmission fidelity protein 8
MGGALRLAHKQKSWSLHARRNDACMPQDKDVVQLMIGYHQLEGKKVALKKPFAILEKVEVPNGSQSGAVHVQYQARAAQSACLIVCILGTSEPPCNTLDSQAVGVVRNKILFKNRPTAVISKTRR